MTRNQLMNWLFRLTLALFVLLGIIGTISVFTERVPPFRSEWEIMFTSNRFSNTGSLVLYRNGKAKQLVSDFFSSQLFSLSPDGEQATFHQYAESIPAEGGATTYRNEEIWALDVDSGDLRLLVSNPAIDNHPVWSPDGKYIAFFSNREDISKSIFKLYVLEVVTGLVTPITSTSGNISVPSWSPDSTQLVFTYAPHNPDSFQASRNQDIYIADITQEPVSLTNMTNKPEIQYGLPIWSPDGESIVFASSSQGTNQRVLYTIDMQQNEITYVSDPSLHVLDGYVWSPDGSQIVVSANVFNVSANSSLYIIDAEPPHDYKLLIQSDWRNIFPVWSPDGSQLAYVHDQRITGRFAYAGRCEIMIHDFETHLTHRLLPAPEGICDTRPQWRR